MTRHSGVIVDHVHGERVMEELQSEHGEDAVLQVRRLLVRDALVMGDGMVRCGKGGLERSWSGWLVQGDYWVKQMDFSSNRRPIGKRAGWNMSMGEAGRPDSERMMGE